MRQNRAAFLIAALACAGLAATAADPSVTNVRAQQRPGTGYVDITYDLANADTATLYVTVAVSTNGGAVYFIPASGLSGDLGNSVARGTGRKIVWNAGAALPPKLYSNVRVRVTASETLYTVRVYNIDDWGRVYVNGVLLITVGYGGDSDWVDITKHLINGSNTVRFTVENGVYGGWTYGFTLRKGDEVIWQDEAGVVGRESAGPEGAGIKFDHTVMIEM